MTPFFLSLNRVFPLALVVVLLLGGCSASEKDPQAYYEKALEHIEKSERDAAILELRSAIQLDARFAAARYQLGLLYLEAGEAQKAFDELLRVVELDPENLDAALKLAQFHFAGGNREESRKQLERVLEKEESNRTALVLLANLELSEGQLDAATANLERLGGEVESSAELQNLKGRIHATREEWQPAEAAFEKAISLDPEQLVHYSTLLRLHEARQDKARAKELLDRMVAKFPEEVQVYLLLAGYHRAVGESDAAEAALQRVIALAPEVPRHRLQLAGFYRDGGKLEAAEATLIEAGEKFAGDDDIRFALADLYLETGRVEKSRELQAKIGSGHLGGRLLAARLQQRDGQLRESIEPLRKLAADYPQWGEPSYYLGLAHYRLGELEPARFAVAEAIQKQKGDARFHTLMAQLQLTQQNFAEAEKEAVTALRLNQKNIPAALLLGRALVGGKKFDQALAVLEDMHRQLPGNPEVLLNLAQAAYGAGDQEKGAAVVAELLEVDPGNIQGIGMVLVTRYRDDLAGGEAFVRGQLAKVPENHRVYLLLGGLLERRDKPEEALAAYERAQELQSEDVRSFYAAAALLKRLGKSDEALAKYQAMVARQPDSLPGHMGIATLLEAGGDSAGAMASYEKMLLIKADFAPAANNLAWLIASEPDGDLGKALRLAMTARQALPDDPNIADTLGFVHLRRESYRLALAQFEIAIAKLPDEPLVAYHLAQALYGDGQQEKAKETLAELLTRHAEFAGRDEAVAMLAKWREG